jgi:hypothetical protein
MKQVFKIIIIIVITTIFSGCNQQLDDVTTNEKIIISKDFYVNSESTELESSVRGTVFLSGAEGAPDHAQIIAFVDIDLKDWGGAVFYIPKNWLISSITSSYPEGENEKTPEDYVTIWSCSETEYEWSSMIEIGTDRSYTPTGAGKGTVIIELDINKETISTSAVFSINIGVGCEEKDGIRSIHPDYEQIEIPTQ